MEAKEFYGKTVEDAITNASVALGVTSDQIKYEVIEEGKSGILGIGSRDAIIKVRLASDEEVISETTEEVVEEVAETVKETVDDNASAEKIAVEFLTGVFKAMELEVKIECSHDDVDDALAIELSGPEMGVLIGKRGQTLDSLQYLTNLAINRHNEEHEYTRVKIDTEDYRRRRKETLENLAKNVAYKVKKTRRPVSLEAMNPNERRIIHSALQNDRYVTTHSEGEEPYRHIVVTLKK